MRPVLSILVLSALLAAPAFAAAQTRKSPTPTPAVPAAQWRGPSAEQQGEIASLRSEAERIGRQVAEAKQDADKLSGGLIKAQIEMRIETLRSTIALLEHRVAALETGARFVPAEVGTMAPDAALLQSLDRDIAASKERIAGTASQSERYSGGLIKAQLDSTRATQEQTLAMLEQRYLMSKYGLTPPGAAAGQTVSRRSDTAPPAPTAKSPAVVVPAPGDTVMTVSLVSKRRVKQKYDEMIILDMDIVATGLDRPARAIKGVLKLTDLFGEERVRIAWDFDNPVAPGGVVRERDRGMNYNQFRTEDRWLDATEQQNMKAAFTVRSILYEDGSRKDF